MKKTFSVVTSVMLTLMMLFVSCEQGTPPALQAGPNDLVSVSFTKVEAKSINVDGIGTVTTPELSELYFQYKAVKTAGEGASAVQGEKTEWTDLGAKGLSQTIQLSRGNWTISLRGFATDALRTAAGTAETASTQAVFEGSLSQDIGSNLTSRNESVNVSLDFTNPDGTGTYVIDVNIPAEYASQQVKVKVTVTPASGDAQVQTHQFDEGTVFHTYSFAGLNNGIATVKLEYMDSRDMEIGEPVSSSILVMTDMTTNGSASVSEDNTFTVSFEGASVNGTAEGKYVPTTFTSLFEIYPDTIADNEIVVGYAYETKALDVTPISFPVEILTGEAVKDEQGRYKASELGLVPVTVTTSSDLNASGATEAWWGKTAALGSGASANTTLDSVRFVDGVTSISEQAFYKCTGLTSITISDGVTSIGNFAFRECSGLASVTIPASVTAIGSEAFYFCKGLTEVTYGGTIEQWYAIGYASPSNANVTCQNGNAVLRLQKRTSGSTGNISLWGLTPYGKANYTEIEIPEGVTEIGDNAFRDCTGLTSITIADGVTSIGSEAFRGCNGLTSITLPDGVTSIGFRAFRDCTGLTSITIPEGVTSIGSEAFEGCSGLTSVTISDGVTAIEGSAFNGCTGLTSINIPESVTSIGVDAFSGCKCLTSITIPSSVTKIGNYAFSGCTALTEATYGGTIEQWYAIGYAMPSTADVTCSNGKALFRLSKSTSSGTETVSVYGFTPYGKANCTEIVIPSSVTTIGSSAFSACSGLTSINIPESVTSIGVDAFSGCTALTSINLPDAVTSIGGCAFWRCTGLTSITIPSSVTKIGSGAFNACTGLTDIYVNQQESTLLDKADVPEGCRIHWNPTGSESL